MATRNKIQKTDLFYAIYSNIGALFIEIPALQSFYLPYRGERLTNWGSPVALQGWLAGSTTKNRGFYMKLSLTNKT
jgi:hypothetical protein